MAVNYDRLIDVIIESFDAETDYRHSSDVYKRETGFTLNLDEARTNFERHIAYVCRYSYAAGCTVSTLFDVLGFDSDQRGRAYAAARIARNWYNKTKWERLIPDSMIGQIEKYIKGSTSK